MRGGPLFFVQAEKGRSNNLVHVIKGVPLSFLQSCWGQRVHLEFLCSQPFFCKYKMEHILYLMNGEYKHRFWTLLGPMSRGSPDLNKQYNIIVKVESKVYLFND